MNNITEENEKKFPKGHFLGMWMGIGIAIFSGVGVPLSFALENPGLLGIWPAIGVAFGLAIGSSIEAKYEKEGKSVVCALNYLSIKPGYEKEFEKNVHIEEEFEEKVKGLCRITTPMKGFLGSKIFKISTISYGGSGLRGEYKDIDVEPTKYVMLTYWTSKEAHEEFHKQNVIMEGMMGLMKYLSIMPYEEYGDILR